MNGWTIRRERRRNRRFVHRSRAMIGAQTDRDVVRSTRPFQIRSRRRNVVFDVVRMLFVERRKLRRWGLIGPRWGGWNFPRSRTRRKNRNKSLKCLQIAANAHAVRRVFSHFSSIIVANGLVCLAVAGFCLDTHRTRSFGNRRPAFRASSSLSSSASSSKNGWRSVSGRGRAKRPRAAFVRAMWSVPATPVTTRAYSSIGQSPRLITGLFLVQVQVGLPLFSGARSRTST